MGWKVAGYTAHELVGYGATGEVWRGVDAGGQHVALKRLRVDSEGVRDRLRREAALLAALDHPHLVRVHEYLRSSARGTAIDVLVMDYASEGSLDALLRRRSRLTPGEVVTVVAPIAAALAYAHGEGLVHGDVTPGNILFADEGRPLLADLGIARTVAETASTQGTPEYIDPVIATGGAPGQRSDVFSIAAVAFRALTGIPLWNAATVEDTLAVAAEGAVPDLTSLAPDAPAELVEIVRRGLSRDPAARGTAAEFALDIRHSCRPEPVDLVEAPARGVPSAARPSSFTHEVRRRTSAGETGGSGGPPGASDLGGRHRRPDRPRSAGRGAGSADALRRRVMAVIVHPALRVCAISAAALVLAVWAGVRWGAGADAGGGAGAADDRAAVTSDGSPVARSVPGGAAATRTAPTASRNRDKDTDPRLSRPTNHGQRQSRRPSKAQSPNQAPSSNQAQSPNQTARPNPTAMGSGQAPQSAAARWTAVLTTLDRAREQAFAQAEPALLEAVYAGPADALTTDRQTVHGLAASDQAIRGVRHRVDEVRVRSATSDRAVLDVAETLQPYAVVSGSTVVAHAAGPRVWFTVELRRTPVGWRIAAIDRA